MYMSTPAVKALQKYKDCIQPSRSISIPRVLLSLYVSTGRAFNNLDFTMFPILYFFCLEVGEVMPAPVYVR